MKWTTLCLCPQRICQTSGPQCLAKWLAGYGEMGLWFMLWLLERITSVNWFWDPFPSFRGLLISSFHARDHQAEGWQGWSTWAIDAIDAISMCLFYAHGIYRQIRWIQCIQHFSRSWRIGLFGCHRCRQILVSPDRFPSRNQLSKVPFFPCVFFFVLYFGKWHCSMGTLAQRGPELITFPT